MDPLSITGSVIAFIGAAVQCARALEELKATRRLPDAFSTLLAEVTDLQYELERARSVVQTNRSLQDQLHSSGIVKYSEAAKEKLEQLQRQVTPDLSPNGLSSPRKLRAFWTAMVYGKSRLCSCRDELRDVRLGLVSSLAVLTAPIVCGIDAKVDHLVEAHKGLHTFQTQLVQNIIAVSQQHLVVQSPQPPLYDNVVQQGLRLLSDSATVPITSSAMTKNPPKDSSSRALVTRDLNIPPDHLGKYCLPWCSCQCHATSYHSSHQSMKHVFGSVSISHSGMPGFAKACNQKQTCRRRMSPKFSVRVRLPRAVARFQYMTWSFSALAGPELRVKLPRLVDWTSPVWQHATMGNTAAVERLFRDGLASPWDVTPAGGNLLHYATDHWNADLCRLLLDADIDPEEEDDFKNCVAIAWDRVLSGKMSTNEASVVASLFNSTNYLSSRSFTVIHKIVLGLIGKDLETELSYDTKEIDSQDTRGRTALSWAAARGDETALRTLLLYGADVHIADIQRNVPLHYVPNTACAELLLQHHADIKALNAEKQTPLQTACRNVRSASLTEFLLNAGAEVNAVDETGETPLHAFHGHWLPYVTVLLDAGADINAKNNSGDSPLRFAITYNCHHLLRRMLDRHPEADFGIVNHYGQSFAHVVARTADDETMRMLADARPHTFRPDFDSRDHLDKTAAEYFAERTRSLDDDESAVLTEAYDKFVQAVSEPWEATETDETPIHTELRDLRLTDKLDITISAVQIEEDDEVEHVFHDAPETLVMAC